MTGEQEPYPTARGVESAIKEAAKKVAQADPSLDVNSASSWSTSIAF